jgi:iron complex outermembrane receptor protein
VKTLTLSAETLTSYEIGSKNRFLNNHLQVNLAGYYNVYGGYQTAGINVSPNPAVRIFEAITIPVKSYGVELEVQARPWENGTFGLNASYNHARYGAIPLQYQKFFSTNEVAPSPPFRLSGSYDHRFDLGGAKLMLRAAFRYVSPHDSSRIDVGMAALGATPYIRVPGRTLADLNATLAIGENVSITGYVRNLTNERFLPDNWNVAAVIPGNPPLVIVSQNSLSDPRTFGAILNFKF